jgi:RNase P/RNase MRP subunit p29
MEEETMTARLRTVSIVIVALALIAPVAAQAQAKVTTYEILDGTVIYVHEQTVVVEMSDGPAKVFEVDSDFRFDVEGKKVPASGLQVGTKLTAEVTTTETPHAVKVTEVKSGTIVSIVGQNITVRTPEGTKMFKKVPSDFVFKVHGKDVPINQITPGMKITATVVIEEIETVTDRDVKIEGKPPKK